MTAREHTPQLIDDADLAAMLGVHKRTVVRWRNERRGPKHLKAGRRVLYRVEDVELWLEQQVVGTSQ